MAEKVFFTTESMTEEHPHLQLILTHQSRQAETPLLDALMAHAKRDTIVSFDVPGHKMGKNPSTLKSVLGERAMRLDVNSMEELDLLSYPVSVIKEAQDLAAEAFGGDEAFFLVNGTTVGIQAMILSAVGPGEKILMPRNAHKSSINALILSGATPVFIQPEVDAIFGISHGVSYEQVEKALRANPDTKALMVTYPTYFGAMTELERICELAHSLDIPVLVDSAHGAHLPFMEESLPDPMEAGADVAVYSLHKTGGSLTQSSLMVMQGKRVKKAKMQKILNMLQTTSASYLLMASLDAARSDLALHAHDHLAYLKGVMKKAVKEIEGIGGYEVLKASYTGQSFNQTLDWSKLTIRVNDLGLTGFDVMTILKEKYDIQMELAEGYVVMAVISLGDNAQTIGRLVAALRDIKHKYGKGEAIFAGNVMAYQLNELACAPREAFYAESEEISFDQAVGRVSADSVMIYPPGIPLVVPGEVISEEVVRQWDFYNATFGKVLTENLPNQITVIKEDD